MEKIVNESKRLLEKEKYLRSSGQYMFDKLPYGLIMFGRVFQRLVSQVGTKVLTGSFHTQEVGIYKCEGGCNIPGVGSLVLSGQCCYFDGFWGKMLKENEEQVTDILAGIITDLVLAFDPMNPLQSLCDKASEIAKVSKEELEEVLSQRDGPFGGNSLSDFFRRNPFDTSRVVSQEYEFYIRTEIFEEDPKSAEEALMYDTKGHEYLELINKHISSNKENRSFENAMCCFPRKDGKGKWFFWINTGRNTNIDGWKSEKDIHDFLKSDGRVKEISSLI
ncbi:MAG: hypothetical protein WC511_02615 [Candidatus Pacearchaeota archaeon]